jgi:UDP-N-acetyl-D-glucosamine dehydrogenase
MNSLIKETGVKKELIAKFKSHEAVIGIIGLGYVGLPLLLRFSEMDFPVIGFDIDQEKVDHLKNGRSYIKHINSSDIKTAFENKVTATTEFSQVKEADALIICVPTPLTKHRDPDISFITSTMETIKPYLREGQVLSLESTTYPGTTDEVLLPYLNDRGFNVGENYFLVYSPEREDPGNPNYTTKTIPKVCGGHTRDCLDVGQTLYEQVIDQVTTVSSTRTAEMTKLLENIHRAVNIGLVNEMKMVADKMDIDIHEVIRAAATKPFGFTPYYPGPGLGGHCIPIDPFYLTWKAKEFDLNTRFIELSGEVNSHMPDYVINKVTASLNKRSKSVNGSKVLVLGISYKKNVDDMRESPSVVLMEKLRDLGAVVEYSDPYVPKFPKMREHSFNLQSVVLEAQHISSYDCILLATDHDDFPYNDIIKYGNLIVDTRGVYLEPHPNVVKA